MQVVELCMSRNEMTLYSYRVYFNTFTEADSCIHRSRQDHDMYTCPLHFTAHNKVTTYYKVHLAEMGQATRTFSCTLGIISRPRT